jgi:hypothetical protein
MHRQSRRIEILAYLASESLSIAEFNVIHFAHYASCPPVTMIRMSRAESLGGHRVWPASTPQSCRDAVASLMAKGSLQLIDDATLGRIEAEMIADPVFGPINGLPQVGDLDFTKEGAALWRQINRELFERDEAEHWTGLGEEGSVVYFATSESTLRRLIDDDQRTSGREILSVSEFVSIGPWRDRWWDVIMRQGFRVTLTYGPMIDDA